MSYEVIKYPDKTSYVRIPESWEGEPQSITFFMKDYESFVHLIQLCEVLTFNNCENSVITIPNLLDAQADRRFNENESSFLYKIAETLNKFEDIHFRIFHPHNPEVVEALFDHVNIIDNSDFINRVLDKHSPVGDMVLMSSDAGSFKPLMKLCDKIVWRGETFSASKARSWDAENGSKFVQQIDRDDFGGKDVLIIDDLCVYGGTFIGLAKLLRTKNVGKLYLAVSHMTVNKPNPELFELYDKVYTTNSKDLHYAIPDNKGAQCPIQNLHVLKLF